MFKTDAKQATKSVASLLDALQTKSILDVSDIEELLMGRESRELAGET